jgi:hypothetical protein
MTEVSHGGTLDEMRLRQYRDQVERRHDQAVETMIRGHKEQIHALSTQQNVQLTKERDAVEFSLYEAQKKGKERIKEEESRGEVALEKVRLAEQKRIEAYKNNSNQQLEKIRQETESNIQSIKDQERKQLKKERAS